RTLSEVLGTKDLPNLNLKKDQKHKDLSLLFAQKLKTFEIPKRLEVWEYFQLKIIRNAKNRFAILNFWTNITYLHENGEQYPFWYHIADFGKSDSIWNKVFEKSSLNRFKTECFELNLNQADDVISAVDQAYNDYQLSNKPSRIKINLFNQDQKFCVYKNGKYLN
ncbi:23045_t:CDS:2, partial [Gigaspora rosea]